MENRNFFILLVIICVLTPGIHYFIAGKNFDNATIRNILVGVQVLGGLILLFVYGKKPEKKKS